MPMADSEPIISRSGPAISMPSIPLCPGINKINRLQLLANLAKSFLHFETVFDFKEMDLDCYLTISAYGSLLAVEIHKMKSLFCGK